MISYISVDRVEGDIAVCELEMIWIEDSRTEDYWKKETIMVDVPMEKFENCGPVYEGDVFIATHNDETVVEVCQKDEEEKARRTALMQAII